MAYRSNDSGCGCIMVFIVVMAIISGIRGCTEKLINGDLKLPKLGSSHVSGGSGGYGTSNGYNVQYNQTTSPSKNNSLMDYTETNKQPTEYREGSNSESAVKESKVISPSQPVVDNTSKIHDDSSPSYYKTCNWCGGTGKRNEPYIFLGNDFIVGSCPYCARTDHHRHDKIVDCAMCSGKGQVKVKRVMTPVGEMEVNVIE